MMVLDLIAHVRNEMLRDIPAPHIFSDDALTMYLNEGLAHMARHTHLFVDEVELETVPGERKYNTPPGTIHVQNVMNERGIALANFSRKTNPRRFSGTPSAYSTDAGQHRIILTPTPDDVYLLTINRAYRPERVANADELPVGDDHALLLAEWMMYRSLRNNDPDGSATVEANIYHDAWQMGLRDLKREVIRYTAGDNPTAQPRSWT